MEQGTIKIRTKFRFLQWIFLFFKPLISIDGGEPEKHKWGQSEHLVAAGQHSVHVEVTYLFRNIGKATTTVDVPAGGTVSLLYRTPWIVTMGGRLEVVAA